MNPSALLEIVIFAVIAFALVTKLLDMLGSTSDDESGNFKSFFGEKSSGVKDVTDTKNSQETQGFINSVVNSVRKSTKNYDDVVADDTPGEKARIIKDLGKLVDKMSSFDPVKFLQGAKSAFSMTVTAFTTKDLIALEYLIDKRFLSDLQKSQYPSFTDGASLTDAKICEAYSFGNSIFIKVRFALSSKETEEWVFTKSLLDTNTSAWQISSINVV